MRHFRRLALPRASGMCLSWSGLEVEDVTPQEIPPLHPGEILTIFARVTSGEGPGTARLTGEVGGESLTLEARIDALPAEAAEDDLVPVLWARLSALSTVSCVPRPALYRMVDSE